MLRGSSVLSWGMAQQQLSDPEQWEAIRLQLLQSMLEHQAVQRALVLVGFTAAAFVLVLGLLCFFLLRRCIYLSEALLQQTVRHSRDQQAMLKQHSLEQSSNMMQMLHGFEGIVSRRRSG